MIKKILALFAIGLCLGATGCSSIHVDPAKQQQLILTIPDQLLEPVHPLVTIPEE